MLQGSYALLNSAGISEWAAFIPSGADRNAVRSLVCDVPQ